MNHGPEDPCFGCFTSLCSIETYVLQSSALPLSYVPTDFMSDYGEFRNTYPRCYPRKSIKTDPRLALNRPFSHRRGALRSSITSSSFIVWRRAHRENSILSKSFSKAVRCSLRPRQSQPPRTPRTSRAPRNSPDPASHPRASPRAPPSHPSLASHPQRRRTAASRRIPPSDDDDVRRGHRPVHVHQVHDLDDAALADRHARHRRRSALLTRVRGTDEPREATTPRLS